MEPYRDSLFDRVLRRLGVSFMNINGQNEDGTENANDLYLRRYYLYRGKYRPHCYLHHIIRSDYDRAHHDHPWDFTSFILAGGYTEHEQKVDYWTNTFFPSVRSSLNSGFSVKKSPGTDGVTADFQPVYKFVQTRRRPFSIIRHKATDLHRLELNTPAWTLVFTGPRLRNWGFLTPDKGWILAEKLFQYIKDMMP